MWEFAPLWTNAKMTKAQVRKYVADMKKAQKLAKDKLEKAKNSWEFEKEKKELENLENMLNDL